MSETRVGVVHKHELPNKRDVGVRDEVHMCTGCRTEFIVVEDTDSGYGKTGTKWVTLDSQGFAVEYDRTVGGEKFIGRAGPDTVFDEPGGANDGDESGGSGEAVAESGDGESGTSPTV